MDRSFTIAPVAADETVITALCETLIEVVANGGSVGFMHPLASEAATAFWEQSLAAAGRGERVVLGAAAQRGRTLLTLDTAEENGAAGLYEALGFIRAGLIPDYAFKPHGGLTGTILYFKRIGAAADRQPKD